jgi:hypothetical protein
MGQDPQLGHQTQAIEVHAIDAPDFEDIIGTNGHVIALGFASAMVNDGLPAPGEGVASFTGTIGVLGGPALLAQGLGGVIHVVESIT